MNNSNENHERIHNFNIFDFNFRKQSITASKVSHSFSFSLQKFADKSKLA